MRARRIFLTLAVVAVGITAGVTPASAEDPPTTDLETYLATLSPDEAQQFRDTMLAASFQNRVYTVPANRAAYLSANGLAAPMATKERCFTQRGTTTAQNSLGLAIYAYYMVGGYCTTGTTVTRAYVADSGNAGTFTAGWRWVGEARKAQSGVINNTGRASTQGHYALGVNGWDVENSYPCRRSIGYPDFRMTSDRVCGIY